jgi:hypothetical protein
MSDYPEEPASDSEDLSEFDPLKGTPFSKFFGHTEPLDVWDGLVQLVPNPRSRLSMVPKELQQHMDTHSKVPAWAIDKVIVYWCFLLV